MASIHFNNVSLRIPVFRNRDRSLRISLMHASTGGRLSDDGGRRSIVTALDNVNFTASPGDRIGIIGPNGAGKTTLLRVAAGILHPTSGRVDRTGSVSAMFDLTLGIDMDASGNENIIRRGLYLGLSMAEIRSLQSEIAEFSELGEYLNLPMRTYSSGMTLRLGFSVVTAVQSDIILMDEWLSVGDANFSRKAGKRLDDLTSRSKILILASHTTSLVSSLCNKALLLGRGAQVAFGPTQEILEIYSQWVDQSDDKQEQQNALVATV